MRLFYGIFDWEERACSRDRDPTLTKCIQGKIQSLYWQDFYRVAASIGVYLKTQRYGIKFIFLFRIVEEKWWSHAECVLSNTLSDRFEWKTPLIIGSYWYACNHQNSEIRVFTLSICFGHGKCRIDKIRPIRIEFCNMFWN